MNKKQYTQVLTLGVVWVLVSLCIVPDGSAQQGMQDVVYLKDGSVIRGAVVEQIPGISIKIQTRDGNLFVFKMEDIDRIAKEGSLNGEEHRVGGRKNPITALGLSCCVGGLLPIQGTGQWYNGEVGKAVAFLGGGLVTSALMIVGTSLMEEAEDEKERDTWVGVAFTGAIGYLGLYIWGCIDAYDSAQRISRERGYASSVQRGRLLLTYNEAKKGDPGIGLEAVIAF